MTSRMRLLIDENVHSGVGDVLRAAEHDVEFVLDLFAPGTPDDDLLDYAMTKGIIIVSHDQPFMARIHRPRKRDRYKGALGFGRIHLVGLESEQPRRLAECTDMIGFHYDHALGCGKSLIITVGSGFVRFDDVLTY